MKKGFVIAAILLVVMIVFVGCNMPLGCAPGGESGGVQQSENASNGNQSDVDTGGVDKAITYAKNILIVPDDVSSLMNSMIDVVVKDSNYNISRFASYFWFNLSDDFGMDIGEWRIAFSVSEIDVDKIKSSVKKALLELGYSEDKIHSRYSEPLGTHYISIDLTDDKSSFLKGFVMELEVPVDHGDSRHAIYLNIYFTFPNDEMALAVEGDSNVDLKCLGKVLKDIGINPSSMKVDDPFANSQILGYFIEVSGDNKDSDVNLSFNISGMFDDSSAMEKLSHLQTIYGGNLVEEPLENGSAQVVRDAQCDGKPLLVGIVKSEYYGGKLRVFEIHMDL